MRQYVQRVMSIDSQINKKKEKLLILSERDELKTKLIENKTKTIQNEKIENDPSKCKTHRPYIPTFIRNRNKKIENKSFFHNQNKRYENMNEKIYLNDTMKLTNQSQEEEREKEKSRNAKFKTDLNTTYDALKNYIKKSSGIDVNSIDDINKNENKKSNDKSIDDENYEINKYYGNAYRRRRKYWSSKSSSRDNKSFDSAVAKNRVSTYKREKNLKEDLKSNINDTKNIIIQLPLCFISKKNIQLKFLPINDNCFISKEIIQPIILPTLDISFISKLLISSKVLPINDNCFISKKICKLKQLPILDNMFITKNIIKPNLSNLSTSNRKRNLSEDKTRKVISLKSFNVQLRKIPINEISFISKKIYIAKNIPLLPLSFISKNILNCLILPLIDNSFISKENKKEIIFKSPQKNCLYISKQRIECIQKPILSLNYISKKRYLNEINQKQIPISSYLSKELIENFKKPLLNNCYFSKEKLYYIKKPITNNCNITKELISTIKKPIINKCYISKIQIKIYKKPLITLGFVSKNYINQTQKIPLIKQCYISKRFRITGYKKPIIKQSFITKTINKGILPIKKPYIKECQVTKFNKNIREKHMSNLSSLSFIDNLMPDEGKIILNSIKEDIKNTPTKENKEYYDFKNLNKDKINNSVNSQISKISRNSEKNISNFGSLQNDDISSDFNEIEKKSSRKNPKLEANLRQRREIEKEIEIQFDDFGMIKEINNSKTNSINKNINNDSEKKYDNYTNYNYIFTEQSPQKINLSLSKSNNDSNRKSNNKVNMSKSQQMDSLKKNNKHIIPNLSMKIPKFKFDKNMLVDLKNELNRRKRENRKIKDSEYIKIRKATQKLNEVLLGKSVDNKKNIFESKIEIGTNKLEEIIGKRKKRSSEINIRKNNRYLHILEQEDKMNKLKSLEKILDNKLDFSQNTNEINNIIINTEIKQNTPIKPKIKKLFKTSDRNKLSSRRQKKEKNITKSNSINTIDLQFILSLKNYPHSLDTYQLPNKVIQHCNNLKKPTYLFPSLNILKTTEKKKSLIPISKTNKNENKFIEKENTEYKENKLYEGLIKAAQNYNNNMNQWARKDMTKEIQIAENYIKELNLNMKKNTIKHDITSILNTITVDNFNDVKNKLIDLLNGNNDNKDKLIEVILEKCIIENGYVILYAQLCKELINFFESKNDSYLKSKLIEACKSSFDRAENEIDFKIILNDEQYYYQKKKILGNINLIADLIDVKILSQKIGFYCINSLYERFSKSNINHEKSMKFINLESLISFLSKFGKIVIKRNKKDNHKKLKNFITQKIQVLKDNKEIPNFLKYKIINLLEKEKNNWEDTLFEKSIIPKGKEKIKLINEEDDYNYKKIDFEDEDAIKEDLTKWINFLNENDIITPSKLEEEILNEYEWENIDKLISDEKVELVEIIRCYLEVSIDLINKKEDIFKANQYINSVIEFYSKYLSKEEINDFNKKIMILFSEVNNLVVDNLFMFEILGNLLYNSINEKLCFVSDLNIFIGSDKMTLKNISKVIKYAIESSGKNKTKFINDLKQSRLLNSEKELFNLIFN